MSEDDFETWNRALLSALERAEGLLRHYGETFWADWLERDRLNVANGDGIALDRLLEAFGGMGSLNDVYFHRMNGHDVDDEAGASATAELRCLNSVICSNASAMKRALDHP